MATLIITIINPSTGEPISGLTNVKLFLGSEALTYYGHDTPNTEVGTMTEEGTSGSYSISIPHTNAYTVRVSGVGQDEYTNVWIPAEDICGTARLNEQGLGSLNSGATEIGVNDPDSRYVGTNVQTILNEISGARAGVVNCNLAWIYALVDGWTVNDAEINALDGAACTNADFIKLHAITATAALINQALTGISANVTAAHLSELTGGTATDLHSHGSLVELTDIRGAADSDDCSNLEIDLTAFSAGGDGGDLLITTTGLTTGATGSVKINGYEVLTYFTTGSLDMTGTHFLAQYDHADEGMIRNCLIEIDSRLYQLWLGGGGGGSGSGETWARVFECGSLSASGAISSDVAMTAWTRTTNTYKVAARFSALVSYKALYTVRLWFCAYMAGDVSDIGYVRFSREGGTGGYAEYAIVCDGTTDYHWYSLTITLNVSSSTPETFLVELKGDGSHDLYLGGHLICEAQ